MCIRDRISGPLIAHKHGGQRIYGQFHHVDGLVVLHLLADSFPIMPGNHKVTGIPGRQLIDNTEMNFEILRPVSYTHLDVYKRQVHVHPDRKHS